MESLHPASGLIWLATLIRRRILQNVSFLCVCFVVVLFSASDQRLVLGKLMCATYGSGLASFDTKCFISRT